MLRNTIMMPKVATFVSFTLDLIVFLSILMKLYFSVASANGQRIIDFRVNGERPSFVPDGMTIDTDGNLYVATWDGSKVLKVDPT